MSDPHGHHTPDGLGTEIGTTEARQGATFGQVRYMVIIGLGLVVIAFLIIYFLIQRAW